MTKFYKVREKDLRGYIRDAVQMDKLHAMGVDNWQGYEECHPTEEEVSSELSYFNYVEE